MSHSFSGNQKNVKYVTIAEDGCRAECGASSDFKFPSCPFLAEAHTPDIMKFEEGGLVRETECVPREGLTLPGHYVDIE